jgi:hypothetical protein
MVAAMENAALVYDSGQRRTLFQVFRGFAYGGQDFGSSQHEFFAKLEGGCGAISDCDLAVDSMHLRAS